jgi:lipopolysaccharide heptosyltransferase II
MTDPVAGGRYRERRHELTYIHALARVAGGVLADDDLPRLLVHPPSVVSLADTLKAAGVPAHCPLIALHPGARNGKAKRWPAEHWAQLAGLLSRRLDATVLLVGASGERDNSHMIARAAGARVYDLTGKTSLPELVALFARCDLVISGDSGPMHIACAVNTPLIGLFGPTDPRISGPVAPNALVMRQKIWCGPCYDASATADCRFHNPVCMKSISPQAVFVAVRRQLAARQPSASRPAPTQGEEVFSATHTRQRPPAE